ncbi:hypothetical protein ACFQZX_06275 [Mucilaginibacter litoreus]|uniref:Uncharacterized protein n=1 Tax=Mucilaginibacter litoreus TaxID=1048221 RepID=A0ABW3ART1_9SPHI
MENLITKSSLNDFTDRELLELILANQVKVFRHLKRLEDDNSVEAHYSDSFGALAEDANSILEQIDEYLKNQ